MIRLARFSIHRPRAALLGWCTIAVLLGIIGLGLGRSDARDHELLQMQQVR